MSVQGDLVAALKVIAPVFPVVAKAGTTGPRFTYQTVGGTNTETFDAGEQAASYVRVQVDCWADDFGTAQRLAIAARTALYASLTVGEMTTNPDDYESDTGLFRASFDVTAWL